MGLRAQRDLHLELRTGQGVGTSNSGESSGCIHIRQRQAAWYAVAGELRELSEGRARQRVKKGQQVIDLSV